MIRKIKGWTSPAKFIEIVQTISGGGKTDDAASRQIAELQKSMEDMKEERYRDQITAGLAAQNKALSIKCCQ